MDQPKIGRMLRLMKMMSGNINYSVEELSEKLEMSDRTIYYYVDSFKNAERMLKFVFNDELWDTLYGFHSGPLKYEKGRKVAVRVVSQFGEESSKVLTM